MRLWVLRHAALPSSPTLVAAGTPGVTAARRPSRRSPTSLWIAQITTSIMHDQHGTVRDRHAVVAIDDAVDDVRRRPFVFRGHEEDHRGERRHRADEAVDERGDDCGLQQRQQDACAAW